MVDDDEIDWASGRFQLQAELFLKCRKNVRPVFIWGDGVVQAEFEEAREAGPIDDGTADIGNLCQTTGEHPRFPGFGWNFAAAEPDSIAGRGVRFDFVKFGAALGEDERVHGD